MGSAEVPSSEGEGRNPEPVIEDATKRARRWEEAQVAMCQHSSIPTFHRIGIHKWNMDVAKSTLNIE